MQALLLAAGVGKRLKPYTEAMPKCLLEVGGHTLLARHLAIATTLGATRFTIVVGHEAEKIRREIAVLAPKIDVRFVANEDYRRGSILSLSKGLDGLDDDVVFMDADVLYDPEAMRRLYRSSNASCALMDRSAEERGEEMMLGANGGRVLAVARRVSPLGKFDDVGESVGFYRIGCADLPPLRRAIAETLQAEGDDVEYENALNRFFKTTRVGFEPVDDLQWTEIDFEDDLRRARDEIAPKLPAFAAS